MTEKSNPGEDKAWELLAAMRPGDVCRAAGVTYDEQATRYVVRSLGMNFFVSPAGRTIVGESEAGLILLTKMAYFFRLSILWYLVSARDVACTGRPVKLEGITGGEIFTKGSHVLPLDGLAKKYGSDAAAFVARGRQLGGEPVSQADAAVRLLPFPRVPVTITLWIADEEFPSRADMLFDSSCSLQLPMDILWSVAMFCALIMIQG
jgi:hypothetical protein